ncbi:CLUMA_CG010102, isoform A [Clunio marinus]|uniref:CLUMA_CG010102, isoform A n=1 Tax=Clunio marinus TaxID=568069 RepID=A0A1J1I8T2_9DIPT|nr:CLUMA_CG010102, isoform A [Clunio marinus]
MTTHHTIKLTIKTALKTSRNMHNNELKKSGAEKTFDVLDHSRTSLKEAMNEMFMKSSYALLRNFHLNKDNCIQLIMETFEAVTLTNISSDKLNNILKQFTRII